MTENQTLSETDIQTAVEKTATKTNVVMDATILTTLMGCPRKTDFKFNHNLHSIKGKSNSIECGSMVHKYQEVYNLCIIRGLSKEKAHAYGMTAAEMYVSGCPDCTNFEPTHEILIPDEYRGDVQHICNDQCVLKPKCGHRIDDYPGMRNTPPDSEGYFIGWKWVLETCQQYYDYIGKNDHWVPLEVETVKSKILYEDEDIRILWKAKLDLLSDTNQGIYPVDHKTMKQNRKSTKMNNQFKGQCLVTGTRQVIKNMIGFQKTLEPKDKFKRDPVGYTSAILTEWYSETLPFYAKLLIMYAENGYFPPNYTNCEGKYGLCEFEPEVCTGDPGMREENIKLHFYVGKPWNPTNEDED